MKRRDEPIWLGWLVVIPTACFFAVLVVGLIVEALA